MSHNRFDPVLVLVELLYITKRPVMYSMPMVTPVPFALRHLSA